VRLRLEPNGEWNTRALIDTGSPLTLFDRGAADALGVRIHQTGARLGTVQLLGGTRQVQFEDVDLCLLQDTTVGWQAAVAFIVDPSFQMPFQGILGTEGFLDRHVVTFAKYYDWFEVCPASEWDEGERGTSAS
jgi:hypothetical protein